MKIYSKWSLPLTLIAAAGVIGAAGVSPAHAASSIQRISETAAGGQSTSTSTVNHITPDGRYVVFQSDSTVYTPGASDTVTDIFVKDIRTGEVRVASAAQNGTRGNYDSYPSQITPDGRYVVLSSMASNLVPGDYNNTQDVFVKDMQTGMVRLASVTSGGIQGNYGSFAPIISSDGRYVVFLTAATNLVPNDFNGTAQDLLVKDMQTGDLWNATAYPNGVSGGSATERHRLSADGTRLVFVSNSPLLSGDTNNSSDIFVQDLPSRATQRVSSTTWNSAGNQYSDEPQISADGRYVSFTTAATDIVMGDTNNAPDVLLKDLLNGTVQRVSNATDGTIGNGASLQGQLSQDGRYVAFSSFASNFVFGVNGDKNVFVKDLQTGLIKGRKAPLPPPTLTDSVFNHPVYFSADGKYVVLQVNQGPFPCTGNSMDCEMDPWSYFNQLFLWDVDADTLQLISGNMSGVVGSNHSVDPQITADGNMVVFGSYAANLTDGDTNNALDVFLFTRNAVPPDADAPSITLNAPADGATYVLNQPVNADFSCADTGSGLASSNGCVGTTASGAAIDTATLGPKSFTVDAKDAAGNTVSKTVNYTVVAGTNNAEFVSQAVPGYMAPGQSYTVALTFKNTGTSYWTPGQRFYLSAQNPVANTTWMTNLVSVPAGPGIAPGDIHTFRFWVKAPTTPGVYNFQWRLAQYGVEWFGQASPNLSIAVGTHNAEVVSQVAPPSTMTPGQRAIVSITVKNTGATTWTYGGGFTLSVQNPVGNKAWGTCLRYLPAGVSVAPGQTHTFTFVAVAPSTPGTYHFQWRMAQSGVAWFGEYSPDVVVAVGGTD